jgi:hypothetical protein
MSADAVHNLLTGETIRFTRSTPEALEFDLEQRVGTGGVVEIPPGRWHMLVALAPTRAHVVVEPAMRFDELIACMAAISGGDVRRATLRRMNELLAEHDCAPRLPLYPRS